MASTGVHYPLLAIPAYYAFCLVPHIYAGALLSSNGYNVNNANPKAALSPAAVKGKVPDAVFQKYQRAENAQSNNLEQLPFFASAILASIIAERTTGTGLGKAAVGGDGNATDMMNFIGVWFVLRTCYVVSYVLIGDHKKSFIRSAFYGAASIWCINQFWKCAKILG